QAIDGARSGNVAIREVVVERGRVDVRGNAAAAKQSLQLAGEQEPAPCAGVVEGLLPEGVAGQEELPSRRIPNGKGKHPIESADAVDPPFLVQVHNDLGVAGGA